MARTNSLPGADGNPANRMKQKVLTQVEKNRDAPIILKFSKHSSLTIVCHNNKHDMNTGRLSYGNFPELTPNLDSPAI